MDSDSEGGGSAREPAAAHLPSPVHASPVAGAADEAFRRMEASGSVSEADLALLNFLFPSAFRKALEICDAKMVTRVTAEPSGKVFFQVEGSETFPYVCFFHYCNCKFFLKSCVLRDDHLYCKHQLAARVAHATNTARDATVSDDRYAKHVCELSSPPLGRVPP